MYAILALLCSQPGLDLILLLGLLLLLLLLLLFYYYRQALPPLAILPGFVFCFICLLVDWFSLPTYVPS